MNHLYRSLVLLIVLGAAACGTSETPPTSPSAPQQNASQPATGAPGVPGQSRSRAPLVLTVVGPDDVQPGASIDVTYTIRRNVANATPLEVSAVVPAGLTLTAGKVPDVIVDDKSGTITRTLTFQVAQVPQEDLVVTVAAKGGTYQVTARQSYRFGRAPGKLPTPSRGQPVNIKGRSLGEPIRLN